MYLSGKLWGSQSHLLHHQKENSNCVLKGICGQVSIDTLDRFLIDTPINTWSLIDTWSTFSQLSTVDQPVDGVSLNRVSPKVSVECWQSRSRVSFKVLIDPRLQVPLGHMIWILFLRMQLMALLALNFHFCRIKTTIVHLMTCPKVNGEFCFPEILNIPLHLGKHWEGKKKLAVSRSVMASHWVLSYSSQLKNSKKLQRNNLLKASWLTDLLWL